MNRFWDAIICPLFNELKPKCIVEVGADCGLNTKNILDYCSNNDSKLVSIDPNPSFNVSDFLKSYGKKFIFFEDLSLNVLQIFNDYDIILIDGDHNWYTVYNELKLIEKNFNQNSFPVVILHDVSWPYGRRDSYYNPENIPKEYRHEFKKSGIVPYQNELDENIGINNDMDNAIYENSPKNGVLTAIEDFLDETNLKLSFYKINGFNGLGIIYPYNKSMDKLISKIVYDSELTEMIEKNYFKRFILDKKTINFFKNQFSNIKDELQSNKANFLQLKENHDNLVDKNESLINVNSRLSEKNKKLNSEKKSLNKLYEDLISERDALIKRNSNLFEKNKKLNSEKNSLTKLNDDLISERNILIEEKNRLNSENNTLIKNNELLLNKLSSMTKSKNKLSFERNSLVKRNTSLSELNVDLISEKDALIEKNSILFEENKKLNSEKNSLTKLNDGLVSEKDSWLERNSNLSNANLVLIDENNLIKKNNSDLSKKIDSLNHLNKTLGAEKVSLVKSLNDLNIKMKFMIEQNQVLTKYQNDLSAQNEELMEKYTNILNSNSWKVTAVLRKIKNLK